MWSAFTNFVASSAVVCMGRCLVLKWMWYPVERVNVVDYVEYADGSGRFLNFQLFESVDSSRVVLKVYTSKCTQGESRLSMSWKLWKWPLPTTCSTCLLHQPSLLDTIFSSGPDNSWWCHELVKGLHVLPYPLFKWGKQETVT